MTLEDVDGIKAMTASGENVCIRTLRTLYTLVK